MVHCLRFFEKRIVFLSALLIFCFFRLFLSSVPSHLSLLGSIDLCVLLYKSISLLLCNIFLFRYLSLTFVIHLLPLYSFPSSQLSLFFLSLILNVPRALSKYFLSFPSPVSLSKYLLFLFRSICLRIFFILSVRIRGTPHSQVLYFITFCFHTSLSLTASILHSFPPFSTLHSLPLLSYFTPSLLLPYFTPHCFHPSLPPSTSVLHSLPPPPILHCLPPASILHSLPPPAIRPSLRGLPAGHPPRQPELYDAPACVGAEVRTRAEEELTSSRSLREEKFVLIRNVYGYFANRRDVSFLNQNVVRCLSGRAPAAGSGLISNTRFQGYSMKFLHYLIFQDKIGKKIWMSFCVHSTQCG